MGFAKSDSGGSIYNKRAWQRRLQEKDKGQGCRHERWQGIDGIMYCTACGTARLPEPWEDDGRDYGQVDLVKPRVENGDTDF